MPNPQTPLVLKCYISFPLFGFERCKILTADFKCLFNLNMCGDADGSVKQMSLSQLFLCIQIE